MDMQPTRRTPTMKRRIWSALAALALVLPACGDEDGDKGEEAQAATTEAPVAPKDDKLEPFVRALEPRLEHEAMAWLESQGNKDQVSELLQRKFKNDPYVLRSVLKAVYLGEGFGVEGGARSLELVEGAGLSARGQRALEALEGSGRYALDPLRYHVGRVKKKIEALKEARQGLKGEGWALSDADRQALVAALRARGFSPEGKQARQELLGLLLGEASPLPALREKAQQQRAALGGTAELAAELEVLLADGLLTYAWDMRYSNQAWFDDKLFPARNTKNEDSEILRGLLAEAARGLEDDAAFETFVEELNPQHVPYQRLVEAYARYKDIVAKGGWKPLRQRNYQKGQAGKEVVALKERLKAEGLYEGPMDEVFGDELERAMISYQETHQLEPTGKAHQWFWKSINVTAEERLQQIELNVKRWRESRIGEDQFYVHVNIPDFHAEVWKEGKLDYRFRVITGNRQLECDRKTKRLVPINSTPLFSDEIEMVIVNPYWNVPERMLTEEILPAWYKDETYLERHGYECVKGSGYECKQMRQKSGEKNALGQVKFIFPNAHSVYMHDTPKKHFFDYPVRAFSHGCVRVHEPLKFAEYLLTQDGSWDQAQFDRLLKQGTESGIRLKKFVPIHIEYYTAQADERGRAHFLADVYRHDQEILEGKTYGGGACTPSELPLPPGDEEENVEEGVEGEVPVEGAAGGEAPAPTPSPAQGEDKPAAPPQGEDKPAAPAPAAPTGEEAPRALPEGVVLPPRKIRTIPVPLQGKQAPADSQEGAPGKGEGP